MISFLLSKRDHSEILYLPFWLEKKKEGQPFWKIEVNATTAIDDMILKNDPLGARDDSNCNHRTSFLVWLLHYSDQKFYQKPHDSL